MEAHPTEPAGGASDSPPRPPPSRSDRTASATSKRLATWLKAHGGYCSDSIDLTATLVKDRDDDPTSVAAEHSVVALVRIETGTVLLRVPCNCALRAAGDRSNRDVAERVLADRLRAVLAAGEPFWDPSVPSASSFKGRGAHHSSFRYASTLPAEPYCLDAWTAEERALLRGTRLAPPPADALPRKRRRAARDDAPTDAPTADRATRLVRTRAVHLDDGSWNLVPGVDPRPGNESGSFDVARRPVSRSV